MILGLQQRVQSCGKGHPSSCLTLVKRPEQVRNYSTRVHNSVCYNLLGGACRIRVLRSLQQRFSTPEVAEQFFTEQNKENLDSTEQSEGEGQQASPSYIEPVSSMNNSDEESISIQPVDMLQPSFQQVSRMKPEDQIQFISELFAVYCSSQNVTAPKDFLQLAVKGMMQLQNAGRSNILYGLSKGLGTLRSDGSDSLFPCKTVVTGLFEHCVNFFSATYGEQVLM